MPELIARGHSARLREVRSDHSRGRSVIDIVEQVQCLCAKGQAVLAPRARATKHAAGWPTASAQTAGAQSASKSTTATTTTASRATTVLTILPGPLCFWANSKCAAQA